jgi:GWxTD domain-containing protein
LNQLTFEPATAGFSDTLQLTLQLTDSSGQKLIHKQWLEPILIDSLQKIEGKFFPQQFEITLQPGQFFLTFSLSELTTNRSGTASMTFQAPSYQLNSLNLSDIQIASHIDREILETTKYIKNGLNIVSNPNRLFGLTLPILYSYIEIYNLQPVENQQQNAYEVKYRLYDMNKTLLEEYDPKVMRKPGTSSFEVGGINVAHFNQQSLRLEVSVTDQSTGQIASAEKQFWIIPSTPASTSVSTQNETGEKIMMMSEDDIENHFSQIRYILPQQAINDFKSLTLEGKRNFLITFWVSIDPDPETPQNELWIEYFKKVEYVNQKYGSSLIQGWKTDRGRIYLKYGKPDEVEYYPVTSNDKPYEIWQYYKPEHMRFIFVDEEGFGRYRLIYSSDEKEVTDPNWQRIISSPY